MNKDEIIKRLQEIIDELKKEDTTEEQAAELQEEARGLKEKLKGINAQERKQKIADEIDKGLIDVRKISDDDKRKAEVDEVIENRKKDLLNKRAITVSKSNLLTPTHQGTTINGKDGEVSTLVDSVATIKLPNGESYEEPYVKTYKEGAITEEGEEYTDTDPEFDYASMDKVKVTAYAELSEEAEKLPAADYVAEVEKACTIAIKKKMNAQMMKGTGTKSFHGIYDENTKALNADKDIELEEINNTTLDEIVYSYGGDEDTNEEATLILNKKDLKAFAQLRSTDGKKIHEIDRKNHTIDNIPYIINSNNGVLSDAQTGAGTYCMAYGKLSNYKIPVFDDLTIKRSEDYKFKNGIVSYRAETMAAGNVVASDGFIRVKKKSA